MQQIKHRFIKIYGIKQDFRETYKRVYVGFEVKELGLYVKLLVQIPICYY